MDARLPLAIPQGPLDLSRSVVDPRVMLAWFQRELPALAEGPIEVTACRAKAIKGRLSAQGAPLRILYRVELRAPGGASWAHTLLGTVPSDEGFMSPALCARCAELEGHPAARPFRRLAAWVGGLKMGLVILPLDPALPGLADVTGAGGTEVLAPFLPECRAGAGIAQLQWQMKRYRPAVRCVLRGSVTLATREGPAQRRLFVKLFRDDRGRALHESMQAVHEAARHCACLRAPQALGYDAQRRMLVMPEVPGERTLSDWIKCLEKDRPLPPGVDISRVERCMAIVAQALRELQATGVRPAPRRTWAAELDSLRRHAGPLRRLQPALGDALQALLGRLEAEAIGEAALVPAHGGFRHKQLLGDDLGLTILDWDGLCLAHPALDAATFLARLRRKSIQSPGRAPEMERLAEVFRAAFLERPPRLARRELAVYEALVLADRALRAFRRPGRAERVPALLAAARALLAT